MRVPFTRVEMSWSWLWGLLLPLIAQYGPGVIEWLKGLLPQLGIIVPEPWGSLLTGVLAAVLMWLSAMIASLAKNYGVKSNKVTNPVLGTKSVWVPK